MAERRLKVKEFDATGSDGLVYHLVQYRWHVAAQIAGTELLVPGRFEYRLANDDLVDLKSDVLQVVATGVKLTPY